MGQMQASNTVEGVCSEIKKIEHNSQTSEAPLKQSIVQNVTNKSTLGAGEFKAVGAHHGPKQ
jgi:hypothetical protein